MKNSIPCHGHETPHAKLCSMSWSGDTRCKTPFHVMVRKHQTKNSIPCLDQETTGAKLHSMSWSGNTDAKLHSMSWSGNTRCKNSIPCHRQETPDAKLHSMTWPGNTICKTPFHVMVRKHQMQNVSKKDENSYIM